MRTTKLFFCFLACLLLTACNGSSGENEEPVTPDPDAPVEISLSVLDENCQILATPKVIAGNSFCIQAKLIKNNLAVTNTSVNFSAPLGSISPPSTLSNENGIAQVILNSDITDVGSNSITASVDDVSASADYEFLESNEPDPNAPVVVTIDVLDSNCQNLAIPSIYAGQSFCIQAKLSKNNEPVINTSVSFSAPIGTLSVDSKLSDAAGIAQVFINSELTDIGSDIVTASTGDVSTTANYEFLKSNEPDPNAPIVVTIDVLDSNCQNLAIPSIYAGQSFCIQAKLSKNNEPVINTSVSFSAPIGTLSVESKLSDAAGIAQVFINSELTDIGSDIVTATTGDISTTANYEFLKSNEPDPNAPIIISIEMLNEQCNSVGLPSFIAGDTVCIKANLSKNDEPVPGVTATFEAPLGTLRQTSKLSDNNGNAIIYLDSDNFSVGSATLTVTQDSVASATQYEFINNDNVISDLPNLSIQMLRNNVANNRFKQGETVEIEIKLTDPDDQSLVNQIINLTTESGTLDVTATLTEEDGIAHAKLSAAIDNTLGAAVLTASYTLNDNSQTINQQFNYQILDADIIDLPEIKAGYFDENNQFVEGKIGYTLDGTVQDGIASLSAGGTLGLKIAIVDKNNAPITTPTAISFTSSCVANQQAQIDEQVLTINGKANATYEDINCAGSTGNTDHVIATIAGSTDNISLTQTIELKAEDLGAIEFIAAEPDSIVLKGTGGQGKQEISTLSFLVKGKLGNPVAQQLVTFSLDTQVGGLSVSPKTAFTNSQGEVSTKVASGNVPTVVRVTATADSTDEDGEAVTISTQSDLLSVNTGLADQNSISLSAVTLNPESHAINGVETQITAWLADSFNNPVPDGTTVNFTTEGGQIEPSCQTVNGSCFVKWESSNPRVFNHRVTILATALGHETFFDTNGNNIFDGEDGTAIEIEDGMDDISSGFGRAEYKSSGFYDLSEAWRDDNEDHIYQTGETFIDYDLNGEHSAKDDKFNGPHCEGNNCSSNKSVNVRKALRLVMASGASTWALYENEIVSPLDPDYTLSHAPIRSNDSAETKPEPNPISRNATQNYILAFADTALQTLAIGSTVTITSDEGELVGQTSFTVSNNSSGGSKPISDSDVGSISIAEAIIDKNVFGGQTVSFVLKNTLAEDDPATVAVVEVAITSPSGITSGTVISIPLD